MKLYEAKRTDAAELECGTSLRLFAKNERVNKFVTENEGLPVGRSVAVVAGTRPFFTWLEKMGETLGMVKRAIGIRALGGVPIQANVQRAGGVGQAADADAVDARFGDVADRVQPYAAGCF